MVTTVRLDESLEHMLDRVSKILQKKRSDIIREAIRFYAENIEQNRKSRILNAIEKTKEIDKKEFKDFEGLMSDGVQR